MPDLNSRSREIKTLVAEDNLNRAIRRLLDFIRDYCEGSSIQSDAILVSAGHKRLVREERMNMIDFEAASRSRNKIIDQVLGVLREAVEFCKAMMPKQNQAATAAAPAPPPPTQTIVNKQEEVVPEKAPEDVVPEVVPPAPPIEEPPKVSSGGGPAGGGPDLAPPTPPPPAPPPPPSPVQPLVSTPARAPVASMQPVCYTKNLHKIYRKSGFHLENVNLQIGKSEILGVVGENGNGKTTLFKILAGELKQDQGEIHYPDFAHELSGKIDWIEAKHHIAYVSQELPRWHGPLIDNLLYEAANYGLKGNQGRKEVEFLVHRLGLVDFLQMKWDQLSGGYKLRFSLAKALIKKPKFMVLDEPFANLDINAQTLVMNDLRDLSNSTKYPVSIVISSQHLHEIEYIADKILFIRAGKPIFYGKKTDLGADRRYNFYEIQSELSKEEIMNKLRNIKVVDVITDAMYTQVVTPLECDCNTFLQEMLHQGLPVGYFRDISKSTKKLFV
ncbi:MAG: ATP-binding cassette domain-containing protein [Bacteroidota bacterium]